MKRVLGTLAALPAGLLVLGLPLALVWAVLGALGVPEPLAGLGAGALGMAAVVSAVRRK